MAEMTIEQALQLAWTHQQARRLGEAETIYRQRFSVKPNPAQTIHLRGILKSRRGNPQTAVDLVRRAIAIEPNTADYYNTLGVFLTTLGQLDEAITQCRRAIALRADYP